MKTTFSSMLAVLVAPAICFGALLGDPISLPQIAFNSTGQLNFDTGTGSLTVTAVPSAMLLTSPPPTNFDTTQARSVDINISVAAGGLLVGGDFELVGTIDLGAPHGAFSGLLLEGQVTAFGFHDSGGPTDAFDFRVEVTGGDLAPLYGDVLVINVISEGSTFEGIFEEDFSGGAKGNINGSQPAPTCDILIDKTCCIPPPPNTGGSQCDGGVTRLLLEFTDDECSATSNTQSGKAKCTGTVGMLAADVMTIGKDADKYMVNTNMVSMVGDTIEITPAFGESKLKNDMQFSIGGQSLEIHMSCSKPLRPGDQFGSVRVLEFESAKGGLATLPSLPDPNVTMCAVPNMPPGSLVCTGIKGDPKVDIVEVAFEYTGAACDMPLGNDQFGKAMCSGDPMGAANVSVSYTGKDPGDIAVSPASNVNVGDLVRLTATGREKLHADSKLNIIDGANVVQSITVHTSCSKPLALGDVFGAFTVVEITDGDGNVSKGGDPVDPPELFQQQCELPGVPTGPHCTGKVTGLTLKYVGGDCSISNQQEGKASCNGGVMGGPAAIGNFDDSSLSAAPMMGFSIGDLVRINTTESKFSSQTTFDVSDGADQQTISFHTSCSKALNLGDRFGSFEVFALDLDDGSTVSFGGVVEYQYTVTNPSLDDAYVTITDDQLGEIATDVFVKAGESVTYFKKATLTDTTKNTATVMADVDGELMCEAMDMVTVDIVDPPPPPFTCSKPIDALTMIWDGDQAVDVIAYQREAGSSAVLEMFLNVMKGDEITVVGLAGASGNDTVWEVFEAGTMNLIGESQFHLSCSDGDMNGVDDCGKSQGDGKQKSSKHDGDKYEDGKHKKRDKHDSPDANFINDWLLEGIVDATSTLNCSIP